MQAEILPLPRPLPRPALPAVARTLALLLFAASGALPALAGEAQPYAAPQPFTAPAAGTGTLRVVLALALVLAAVYGAAWLLRRLRTLGGVQGTGLQVIGQVGLGARERAVLLRAGDQQLLLGVAPGSVRLLCELRAGALPAEGGPLPGTPGPVGGGAAPAAGTGRPAFRELLLRSLGK